MVDIIGRDLTVKKNVTCRSCGSILAYGPKEVQTQNNGKDISGGPDGYEYVICPSCGDRAKIRSW